MGWLIAIFVVALVIGPLMYLKPTNKEKRISALRLAARSAGLNVKLSSVPVLDPEPTERVTAGGEFKQPEKACVAYQKTFSGDSAVPLDVLILRIPNSPTVPFDLAVEGWALTSGIETWQNVDKKVHDVVKKVLDQAPEFCIGLGVDARFLSCYWYENGSEDGPEVAQIRDFLADAEQKIGDVLALSPTP